MLCLLSEGEKCPNSRLRMNFETNEISVSGAQLNAQLQSVSSPKECYLEMAICILCAAFFTHVRTEFMKSASLTLVY